MPALERVSAFIQVRRRNPDTKTLNILNSSLSSWLRYYQFLSVIKGKYEQINAAYMEAVHRQMEQMQKKAQEAGAGTSQPVAPEEWEEMQRTAKLGTQLHLEIESFYVFANILLDRIASTFRYYFWRKAGWSHWQLTANLGTICTKKSLKVTSNDWLKMPGELQDQIVAYRNTRVEHVDEPRIHFATVWGPDKRAKICPIFLYPSQQEAESQQVPSGDLGTILDLLDRYMTAMVDFFEANADKSELPPPA